jgi:pimeloyl-ACP methyl ester carboxylesterase
MHLSPVHYRTAAVRGVSGFCREDGPDGAPAVLLLHGFHTSSYAPRPDPQALRRYNVIALDRPATARYVPRATTPSTTWPTWLTDCSPNSASGDFANHLMDFGAPIGFRLALLHPERLSAIVAQKAHIPGREAGLVDHRGPVLGRRVSPAPPGLALLPAPPRCPDPRPASPESSLTLATIRPMTPLPARGPTVASARCGQPTGGRS